MKLSAVVMLAGVLVACASNNVVVRLPPRAPPPGQVTQPAKVVVNDLRAPGIAASTREAAFGTPMGNVTFDPPEKELVKNLLEVALSQRTQQAGTTSSYSCDILEFGVNTKATPLYWDVIGVIRLKLKTDGREQDLAGTHTQRTYVWPSAELIGTVVQESLQKAVEPLGR